MGDGYIVRVGDEIAGGGLRVPSDIGHVLGSELLGDEAPSKLRNII
jgi:hypothetical protein